MDLKTLANDKGYIYVKTMTMTNNNATRFLTTDWGIYDGIILVETQDMLFGSSTSQIFPVAAGSQIQLKRFSLSRLYFKNRTAGQNSKVTIIGTRVDIL